MSLPMYTFVVGISGVFLGMIVLQIFVNLSSKLAMFIEGRMALKENNLKRGS